MDKETIAGPVSKISKTAINILTVVILVVGASYGAYEYLKLRTHDRALDAELKKTVSEYEARVSGLENDLFLANATNTILTNEVLALKTELLNEKAVNDSFQMQISQIQDMVGALDKLSKTDEELLKKYSKVYFLNEHYTPASLIAINSKYIYGEGEIEQIHAQVWPFLFELFQNAENAGVNLQIISAFRSFNTQEHLKDSYKVVYGTGANQFSADQGYSEHQLGTAVDFTTPALGSDFSAFEHTSAYGWLLSNAYKYGFTLSYPKDNAYYIFEPWHWRFVGVGLAEALQRDGLHFYDLDQRIIDGYLISIFDK